MGQLLHVEFTPNDTSLYNTASKDVSINVLKAPATLTLSNLIHNYDATPKSATVATSPSGLSGVSITYNGSATAPTNAGSYTVVASLNNPNYQATNATGTLLINKTTPTVSWNNPADITYGMALSATQLNANASVAGSFAYTPGAGTVLNAGNGQTLSAVFTPADTTNYNTVNPTVVINVLKAPATLTLSDLTHNYDGTPKSATVATSPSGLSGVSVTYNGSPTAPTNAGSYAVVASLNNPKYAAPDATGTLLINAPPTVGTVTLTAEPSSEGSSVTASVSFTDTGLTDPFSCTVNYGSGPVPGTIVGDTCTGPAHTYADNGFPLVTVAVTDRNGATGTNSANHTVKNVAPLLAGVVGSSAPIALGNLASVTGNFSDVGVLDTHTCTFLWDDATADTVLPLSGTGNTSCHADHMYANPGVYSVKVTVTDKDGGAVSALYEYVVIYDPNGGFVTGGGFIDSPAGAFFANPDLIGKANFGFVSKYQKGAKTPSGQTEFQFKTADLNFHSENYEWLVVSGPLAQYKGVGTINGQYGIDGYDGYGFLLTATDGQQNGGGGVDKFRIKIWDRSTETIIYDNVVDASDDIDSANPQTISGGSIVIHSPKR
jgi:hypothetical protein